MPSHKNADDLTEEEIRKLLTAKLRSASQKRLERLRRSGRRVELVPDVYPLTPETLSTRRISEEEELVIGRSERARKRPSDIFLGLIEVIALVGFLYFIVNGIGLHHMLNRAVAVALQLPTLTPTPLVVAIVLPSGHVHSSLPSDSQPAVAEIPKHLRPIVQSSVNITIPTPGPQQGTRIRIPAIDVDAPIFRRWER
jgi:sortase A